MSNRSVLIIDDSAESVLVMSSILGSEPVDVTFSLSGEEGLVMAREQKPDIILLDIEMAGMSGLDVCRELKKENDLNDVPVIFVSGHESESVQLEALSIGAADFISKPYSPAIALARVRIQLAMKELTDKLKDMATTDPLTQLYNRRVFDERLSHEWRRAQRVRYPISMLMIDVDYFKKYNDFYGHPKGDECLKKIASTVKSAARRATDTAARYGGEEFSVMLPEADVSKAISIGKNLCESIQDMQIEHNKSTEGFVTVSVGVSSITPHLSDKDETVLTQAADNALYASKNEGRNRVSYKML